MLVALYIIAGIIVAILLIAAIMPSSYTVEKSTVIKKPAAFVKSRVADLQYYKDWNPWKKTDPGSEHEITGSADTPGHKYAWNGKKIGMGSLTLKHSDDKHVNFDLQFIKPWKAQADDNWLFESWGDGGETKVTWQNSGKLPWPIARLISPLLRSTLNKQFDQGLQNLKAMCEQ